MDAIDSYIKEQRKISFENSNQLTLGQIIKKLEGIEFTHGEKKEPKEVEYDFGTAIPTNLDSWRGSYSELALGYKLSGYDNDKEHFAKTTVEGLLKELKGAIGKTYIGWKGGQFIMDESTPVWVANSGNSGRTAIVDVIDEGYYVLLLTAYCKY